MAAAASDHLSNLNPENYGWVRKNTYKIVLFDGDAFLTSNNDGYGIVSVKRKMTVMMTRQMMKTMVIKIIVITMMLGNTIESFIIFIRALILSLVT